MNEINHTVTEADLHAYADGQLPEAEPARIEAWLGDNPDDAARVAEWTGPECRDPVALCQPREESTTRGYADSSGGRRTASASWPKRLGDCVPRLCRFSALGR